MKIIESELKYFVGLAVVVGFIFGAMIATAIISVF